MTTNEKYIDQEEAQLFPRATGKAALFFGIHVRGRSNHGIGGGGDTLYSGTSLFPANYAWFAWNNDRKTPKTRWVYVSHEPFCPKVRNSRYLRCYGNRSTFLRILSKIRTITW